VNAKTHFFSGGNDPSLGAPAATTGGTAGVVVGVCFAGDFTAGAGGDLTKRTKMRGASTAGRRLATTGLEQVNIRGLYVGARSGASLGSAATSR
jgi:hypothetical protein